MAPRTPLHDVDLNAPARRDEREGEGAIRGTARMEAFADGVFAIAFTLPIFNVILPAFRHGGADFGADLLAIWPQYLGYLIASAIIGLYWVHHHFSGAIYRTTGHWFLLATALFLTVIGFIAFPARAFAESIPHPAALPAASRMLVLGIALISLTWLVKWSTGVSRGQVDPRLEPDYVRRLTRRYRAKALWNLAAAALCFVHWQTGLVMALAGMVTLIIPPETPRYQTEAPPVEGES